MSFTIIEDKAQQAGKHEIKHEWFQEHDVSVHHAPLPVGDYILLTDAVTDVIARKEKRGVPLKKMDFLGSYKTSIDTKKDLQEIISNICGKQHARFRDECILAKNNGIQLYVLVENTDGVTSIEDLKDWVNPRSQIIYTSKVKESLISFEEHKNGVHVLKVKRYCGAKIPYARFYYQPLLNCFQVEILASKKWKGHKYSLRTDNLQKAKENVIKFVCENTKVKTFKAPNATDGVTLAKAMLTMEEKYGVKFLFCPPDEAGERILSLLTE